MKADRQKLEMILARKQLRRADVIASGVNSRTWARVINEEDVLPRTIGLVANILEVDISEILAKDKEG